MKRFYFFLSVLVMSATLAIGQQMSNTEIMKMILRSSHLQQVAGITNPDLIYPGQVVSYIITHKVQPGECQWSIVESLKPVIRQNSIATIPPVKPTPPVIPTEEKKGKDLVWWSLLLLVALLVGILFYVWYRILERNPATAGTPRIPGGINSPEEARNQIIKTAKEYVLPGSSVRALNLDAGLLSTRGNKKVPVRFGVSGKAKMLRFKNIDAFAADILVDGKMMGTGYVIQRCGNDAGDYLSGDDLIFVRQNGSSRPHVMPGAPVSKLEDSDAPISSPVPTSSTAIGSLLPVVPESIPAIKPVMSEYITQTDKAMKLAEKVLGKDDPHEVTFEIPKGSEGTFKMTIKAQYPKEKK